MNDNSTISATQTVTYTATVDRDGWASRNDVDRGKAASDFAEWLRLAVQDAVRLPADCWDTGAVRAEVHEPSLIEITDDQARALVVELVTVLASRRGLYSIRLDPRKDGVAVKINEGAWSPTFGAVVPR